MAGAEPQAAFGQESVLVVEVQIYLQTAYVAALLGNSSLVEVGSVQLATSAPAPAPRPCCAATCIRFSIGFGTVGSSIVLSLSAMHCRVVKSYCGRRFRHLLIRPFVPLAVYIATLILLLKAP